MVVVWIIDCHPPGAILGATKSDFELAASHSCASLSPYTFSALYTSLITAKISPTDLGVRLVLILNKLLPREPISTAHSMLFDSKLGERKRRVFFFAWK
jgi:hypothetical protein